MEARARANLRLDALFCACTGAITAVLGVWLDEVFGIDAWIIILIGIATVVWALAVRALSRRAAWVGALRLVAVANTAALVVLGAIASSSSGFGARLLLVAVALAVAAFAVTQFVLLHRIARAT